MQAFAIIPGAGRSQRMGRPKLLLPWGSTTVVEHLIGVWRASRVTQVVLVAHPDDRELTERARASGASVVVPPVPPPEMKDSVLAALDFIGQQFDPRTGDAWLLSPADVPAISASTIDRLLDEFHAGQRGELQTRIWVPMCQGKRGHPVLFDWSLAAEVARLGADEGVNALRARHGFQPVEVELAATEDLDTPEDYERLRPR